MKNIVILGGGSWGTALARLLSENGNIVTIWLRDEEQADRIRKTRENNKYLPGINIGKEIMISSDINCISSRTDILVLAVPTQEIRKLLQEHSDIICPDTVLLNVSKGIEKGSLMTISQICREILPENKYAVLSGPSHAEEVAYKMPTTVVAASNYEDISSMIQDVFMNDFFRVYTQDDVIGVEIGGALKNVIAIAAGISDGLGYGDNTKAAIINRGILEIARLAECLGAKKNTFLGLAGIGDLIVTCTSKHSRNRYAGYLIGKGRGIQEAINEVGMVVEGFITTHAAYNLSIKKNIEMPIVNELYNVLFMNTSPLEAVNNLMKRDKKEEKI